MVNLQQSNYEWFEATGDKIVSDAPFIIICWFN
jgi:hypothetical protein